MGRTHLRQGPPFPATHRRPVAEAPQGHYDDTMRPHPLRANILALAMAAFLVSCSRGGIPPRVVVALDEAFAAARPTLASKLESRLQFGNGPAGLFHPAIIVHVAMTEGAGKALDTALAEKKRSGKQVVLVASPLIAKAIINGGAWSGDPPLLVPEWPGKETPGLWTVSTDPLPAYNAAGAAAGAYIAALAKEGGVPSCGVLFSEAPSRPRAALTAFTSAFTEASGAKSLSIRELVGQKDKKPLPVSATSAAEAAVKELLGTDIRLLFLALGAESGATIRSAARSGLVLGADLSVPESPPSLAFIIHPDDTGLARALDQVRRTASFGGKGTGPGGSRTVPALLIPGPATQERPVSKLDFVFFLSKIKVQVPSKH